MKTIKLLHEHYNGTDQGNDGQPIALTQGESIEVSDAKAEQLANDLPDWFEIAGATKEPTRKELVAHAKELGAKHAGNAKTEDIAAAIAARAQLIEQAAAAGVDAPAEISDEDLEKAIAAAAA